jgi:putative redox protein
MGNIIDCETITAGTYQSRVATRSHTLTSDEPPPESNDTGPSPHDLFDSALAACKVATAMFYAKHHNIPLERVESHVERDNAHEREGRYRLTVHLEFHGALTDEQRKKIYDAIQRCPIHKLMTTTDVEIETAPLVIRQ